MTRRAFAGLITAALLSWAVWYFHAKHKVETSARQKAAWHLEPVVDGESVEEIGYIFEVRVQDDLRAGERAIHWFVRIPATNRRFSCGWESGYPGFTKDDAVKLIHKRPEIDEGDYSGFVVGLHGSKSGKSAAVWVLDLETLELDAGE
jgi:hypothetical protein